MPAAFSPGELRHVTASESQFPSICQVGLSVPCKDSPEHTEGFRALSALILSQTVPGHIFFSPAHPSESPLCQEGGRRSRGKAGFVLGQEMLPCSSEILPGLTERQGPSVSYFLT